MHFVGKLNVKIMVIPTGIAIEWKDKTVIYNLFQVTNTRLEGGGL